MPLLEERVTPQLQSIVAMKCEPCMTRFFKLDIWVFMGNFSNFKTPKFFRAGFSPQAGYLQT